MSDPPTIFGYPASTFTRMALVAAEEKGIEAAFREVASWDGYDKLPDNDGLHPFGKVPVLEHAGQRITETVAILVCIDAAFDGPPLIPRSALGKARMWETVSTAISYAWPVWVRMLATERLFNPMAGDIVDETAIVETLPEMIHAARVIGGQFRRRGEGFDLSDIVVAGALAYAAETPEWERFASEAPDLADWWNDVSRRPSIRRHMAPTDWEARRADYSARHPSG